MTAIPKAEMNMAPDRFKALDPMFRNSDPNLQTLVKEVAGWAQLTVDRERKLDEDSRERHEIVKQAIEENRNVVEKKLDRLLDTCSQRMDKCGVCFVSVKKDIAQNRQDISNIKSDLVSISKIGAARMWVIVTIASLVASGMTLLGHQVLDK